MQKKKQTQIIWRPEWCKLIELIGRHNFFFFFCDFCSKNDVHDDIYQGIIYVHDMTERKLALSYRIVLAII